MSPPQAASVIYGEACTSLMQTDIAMVPSSPSAKRCLDIAPDIEPDIRELTSLAKCQDGIVPQEPQARIPSRLPDDPVPIL